MYLPTRLPQIPGGRCINLHFPTPAQGYRGLLCAFGWVRLQQSPEQPGEEWSWPLGRAAFCFLLASALLPQGYDPEGVWNALGTDNSRGLGVAAQANKDKFPLVGAGGRRVTSGFC